MSSSPSPASSCSSSSPFPAGAKLSAAAASGGMPGRGKAPRTRAATWSPRETLEFLALWGAEGIQAQLSRCHRNADVYQWISERMAARGYSRDEDQCRTKGKDLKKSYKQAKLHDGLARQRCRFFPQLDAILGGGGGGGGRLGPPKTTTEAPPPAPWCRVVVVKEEESSEPELGLEPPEPGHLQGGHRHQQDCTWTAPSDSSRGLHPPSSQPSTAPSSPPQGTPSGFPFCPSRAQAGGLVKEEEEECPAGHRDPGLQGGAAGLPVPLYHPQQQPEGPPGEGQTEEEGLLPWETTHSHLDGRAPRKPCLPRRAFPRRRPLLSTRETLAQLRGRRKRPWDDRLVELIRDMRAHFREQEKVFQGLWEEEKAQREKDRRLWAAEMDWVRQTWAKSHRERGTTGEEEENRGPRPIREEHWGLCRGLEGPPPEDPCVQEPLPLKAWLESHGRSFGHFVDGKWLKPGGRETHATKHPTTGEHLATTLQGNGDDVKAAVSAAREAFQIWGQQLPHVRARHLYNLARNIQKHQRLLSLLESLDSGELLREARDTDLPLIVRHFYHYAGWAQLTEEEMKGWKPLGVVAILVPRNFPLLTVAWKVCPALAMGNTVVLKPASSTRLTALLLAELCVQAGLPPGVLNVVTGDQGLGEALAAHPGLNQVAFAGSAEAGRSLRRATAGTGKKLSLQLGGKSLLIVFDSADLDSAVDGLVEAIWLNRGQAHNAGSQLLLQESIARDFLQRLKHRMGQLRVGDCLDKAVDLGALTDAQQQEAIESLVADARAEGAEVFQAWAALPSSGPFYPPTLITGVHTTSRCVREELQDLGPVLVSLTFRTAKEAVALGNSSPSGLAASVWTETLPLALEVARSLQVGTVWINGHNMLDAASAFGGCKESGYGRDGGKESLYEYVRPNWETCPCSNAVEVNCRTFATSQGTEAPLNLREKRPPDGVTPDPGGTMPSVYRTYKLYYGGAQKRPDSRSSRAVLDRAGKVLAYVADGSIQDLRNAVEAAHKAAPGWAKQTAYARAQILYYLAENLEVRRAEVASGLEALAGVEREEALQEVELSIQRLFHWAAYSDKYGGAVQETVLYGASLLFREPVGVVGIACPNERPLLSFISLLAPAVVRGNCVVMVPSERYPLPALDFYQVLDTSDVPSGVVNIISGNRDHLSRGLAEHQDVQAVWYFGSKEGSTVVEWASSGNLKRTWVSYGAQQRRWSDPQEGAGEEFLYQATRCKSVWMPMGDIFAN